jgi:hypothetical protein
VINVFNDCIAFIVNILSKLFISGEQESKDAGREGATGEEAGGASQRG